MKRKIIIASLVILISTGGYFIYKNQPTNLNASVTKNHIINQNNETVKNQHSSEKSINKIETINSTADFAKVYTNIDQLVESADVIVEGKILETSSFDYLPKDSDSSTVLTKVKIQVSKSFNDDVKEGDILTFIEPGGVTTKKALGLDKKYNLPKEKWNDKVQVLFNGVPNMKQNEKILLFGVFPESGFNVTEGSHYWVVGGNQGKFDIDNNQQVQRFVPKQMEGQYTSLKSKLIDMEQNIITSKKKKNKN